MFIDALARIWRDSGFAALTPQHLIMILIAFVLVYNFGFDDWTTSVGE